MANAQKIRIRLKAYDHELIDQSAEKIIETAKAQRRRKVSGPDPARRPRSRSLPSCVLFTSTRILVSSSSAAPTSA